MSRGLRGTAALPAGGVDSCSGGARQPWVSTKVFAQYAG